MQAHILYSGESKPDVLAPKGILVQLLESTTIIAQLVKKIEITI